MNTLDPATEVGKFLARFNGGVVPAEDADVYELGAITSLVAVQLVLFIEKAWSLEVPPSELKRENFSSLRAICALVGRLSGASLNAH